MNEYVELRNGEYYVAGTRVPVECVVEEFRRGSAPETVLEAYPVLTLEQVYGTIACYLGRRQELDEHFRVVDKEYEQFQAAQTPVSADLRERLERARQQLLVPRS